MQADSLWVVRSCLRTSCLSESIMRPRLTSNELYPVNSLHGMEDRRIIYGKIDNLNNIDTAKTERDLPRADSVGNLKNGPRRETISAFDAAVN